MTPSETAWLAGLMEGEGSFGNYSRRKTSVDLRVRLAMCDLDVVQKAAAVMGGTPIYTYDRKGQGGYKAKHKPLHCITLRGYKAARVMEAILPFMGLRRSEKIGGLLDQWNGRDQRTRERGLAPTCHPEREHHCQGLCGPCYRREYRIENKEKMNAARRDRAARQRMTMIDPSIEGEWHP